MSLGGAATPATADFSAAANQTIASLTAPTNSTSANTLALGSKTLNISSFKTGLVNPSVTIRGSAGGTSRVTNFIIADGNIYTNGGSTAQSGTVDLTAGTVDALINNLNVGVGKASSNTAGSTGLLTYNTGTIDANTVTVGIRGTTTAAAASTGTITLGGTAVLNVNAGGLKLADTSVGASTGTTTGILNINGTSTVNMVGGDILGGGGTSTITLNGGTLDLQYHNLDTSGGPIANLNLQTGTLKNVLEINGGGVGLTKTVAGTLIVDGVNAYTGNTNVNAGTLALAAGGSITGSTTITVASGAIANINGTVPTNATVHANGTTNFGGTTGNALLTRTLAALNIAGGVTASITPSTNAFTPTFLSPTSLSFGDGSAKLDLTNNAIIATGDQDVALTLIQSGQVFSSTLADPNHALGYTSVPSSSNMEIRYTFKGDTKLDGKVNVGDLGALATNYNTTGGMSWANGDFNQDHTVNVADLGALATNYNVQLGSGSSSAGGLSAEPLAVVAASALSSAAVPEPSTFALLGLGALGQMSRRPRRHNV